MKKSLKIKLCITGIILIALFIILNILFTYFGLETFSAYLASKQMKDLADSIDLEEDYSDDKFEDLLASFDEDYNTKVSIVDSNKEIIVTTKALDERRGRISDTSAQLFDEKSEEINNGEVAIVRKKSDKTNVDSIKVIVIKKVSDNRYAILSRSVRSLRNATRAAIYFDIIIGVILLFIGLFVVLRLSKYIVKPIDEMTVAAHHISNLDFDVKIEVKGEDELAQLGESINRMSQHLESNVMQLQNDIDNRKRLVRNLSHEIKSPIAVIMGYADRMSTMLKKNPERAEEYCTIISNESTRVDVLVKEMLEFSRLEQKMETIYPEKIRVCQLFDKLEKRTKEEFMEHDIQFEFSCGQQDIIYADFLLIERAIYNLVNNGVSHSIGEGNVVSVTGIDDEKDYMIRVHNTGSHIPEEEIDSIWEAFYKVDKARVRNKNGCGIGLSIVREIVEAHQGSFEAGNDETGVYFCISLQKNLINS